MGRRDVEAVEVADRREAVADVEALEVEARPAARLAAAAAWARARDTTRTTRGAGGDLAGMEAARRTGVDEPAATVVRALLRPLIGWRQTGQAGWLSSQDLMHRRQKTCVQGVMAGFLGVSRQIGQSLGMVGWYVEFYRMRDNLRLYSEAN